MRPEQIARLSASATAFRDLVWPAIAAGCGGGVLVPMEGVAESVFASKVDRLSGVDAWQIIEAKGVMRSIASRVQFGRAYASFTIRETLANGGETELGKRLLALHEKHRGWLLPALTVQGYVSSSRGGALLYAAVAYSEELYKHIDAGGDHDCRTNPDDGNTFVVLWVDRLKAAGIKINEVEAAGANPIRKKPKPPSRQLGLPL
jgi:hypothetical protein